MGVYKNGNLIDATNQIFAMDFEQTSQFDSKPIVKIQGNTITFEAAAVAGISNYFADGN